MQEENYLINELNKENNQNLYNILYNIIFNKNNSEVILISGYNNIGKFNFIIYLIDQYFQNDSIKKQSNLHILGNNFDDILIEETRNAINFLSFNPIFSEKKFLIINGIDLMNKNSINSILKSCEDVENNTIIIALNSKRNQLEKTINSRFKKFNFKSLNFHQFKSFLNINSPELEFYFHFTKGSIQNTLLYQKINLYEYNIEILKAISNNNLSFVNYYFSKIQIEIDKNKYKINHKNLCYNLFLQSLMIINKIDLLYNYEYLYNKQLKFIA